jgi:hypothetical protein
LAFYLAATRDVGDGPFFMTIKHVALICFFFWIMHLVMRPWSGMASAQRRMTSGVQADTCSSVYADAGAIIAMIKTVAKNVRMEVSPALLCDVPADNVRTAERFRCSQRVAFAIPFSSRYARWNIRHRPGIALSTTRGNHMRHSAAIGIAVYVALVGCVIGGAYAAVEAIIGTAPAQTASLGVVKQGPGAPNSRKWTPVEIRREVAELPPLPAYVAPSSASRARVAKNVQRRVVVVAQRAAPTNAQRMASYSPIQSYAPVEESRSFGPFNFKF